MDTLLDTKGTFERAFTPVEDGYLYYPWRWSQGYLVTREELETLKANQEQISIGKTALLLGVALIAAAALMILLKRSGFLEGLDASVGGALAGAFLAPIFLWRSWAPQRLVWGRKPIAPRLTHAELVARMATVMNWPMTLFVTFGMAAGLVVALRNFATAPWLWGPLAVLFVFAIYEKIRVILNKRVTDQRGAEQ